MTDLNPGQLTAESTLQAPLRGSPEAQACMGGSVGGGGVHALEAGRMEEPRAEDNFRIACPGQEWLFPAELCQSGKEKLKN